MSFPRRLEPELLDQMAADDPRAIRVRRDLRLVNAFMCNAQCMASALKKHAADRKPHTIVDLGSGDGRFALLLARQLAKYWPGVRVILLDQQNIVNETTRAGFAALNWSVETVCADVFDFLTDARGLRADVITSNLFLHHFNDEQLAHLLSEAAKSAWLVVACEPRRSKFVVRASRLLWMAGCSRDTIHDAVVSARAGFTAQELGALWPSQEHWKLDEQSAGVFTHCFAARCSEPATAPAPAGHGAG
jgi:SAM-dependent methyltransferase